MKALSRAFLIARLTNCPGPDALRRVWDSFSDEAKADKEVLATRYQVEKGFGK